MKMEKPERKTSTMDINLRLPLNIIEVIFSKLPIANYPGCRAVCNDWNELILNYVSSSSKIIPHSTLFLCACGHQMYCIDFNENCLGGISCVASLASSYDYSSQSSSIMCYCNGLLLIYTSVYKLVPFDYILTPMMSDKDDLLDILNPMTNKEDHLDILNPMTNEYFRLPVGGNSYEVDKSFYCHPCPLHFYGFGFSPKTNRYKVVRVLKHRYRECNFEIFTFGGSNNDQWRCVEQYVPLHIYMNGVYFNGALYWIGLNKKKYANTFVICRFDLEEERIESTISLPLVAPCMQNTLEAFNDSVYATFVFGDPYFKIEVWRMQNCGGEDSWTREFVLKDVLEEWVRPSMYTYFKLVKCYEDGEILCLINGQFSILYNPKYESIKILNQFLSPLPTFDSIFRLDSCNFGSLQKILVNK